MTGIASSGVYIPAYRLPLAVMSGGPAARGSAEKSVAGFDEDVITMAVEAARRCLRGNEHELVDALYLASTSFPFAEKQSAAVVARALNLAESAQAMDFGSSLQASGSALIAAINAVKAKTRKMVLVVASDCRRAKLGSAQEHRFGDAAVAFLITPDGIAEYDGSDSIHRSHYTVWRGSQDTFVNSWEDRFTIKHGYQESVTHAVKALSQREECPVKDYHWLACYGTDKRSHNDLARSLGFAKEQVVDPLFGRVGDCGVALTPLLLASALERAQTGQRLLAVYAGDGALAVSFTLAEGAIRIGPNISDKLSKTRIVMSREDYLTYNNLSINSEPVDRGAGISATVHYREQDNDIGFVGQRCKNCSTIHFPSTRVCYRCFSKDQFSPEPLSRLNGQVLSYTKDYFFPSASPPLIAGMCEVGDGGRVYLQMADTTGKEDLQYGMPVEFVFRKIHQNGGKPAYFWKSRLLNSINQTLEDITDNG